MFGVWVLPIKSAPSPPAQSSLPSCAIVLLLVASASISGRVSKIGHNKRGVLYRMTAESFYKQWQGQRQKMRQKKSQRGLITVSMIELVIPVLVLVLLVLQLLSLVMNALEFENFLSSLIVSLESSN